MTRGWVKLWRKSLDSAIFCDAELWRLWTACLMLANHDPLPYFRIGMKEEITIMPGQFVTGRYELLNTIYKNKGGYIPNALTVWRWLGKLKTLGNLNIETNNRFSLVTICNWELYQGGNNGIEQPNEQQMNNRCTTDEQQMNTNKNDKNDKKEDKEEKSIVKKTPQAAKSPYGEFKNVLMTSDEYEKLVLAYGEVKTKSYIDRLDLYVGGNKAGRNYTSHYLTILAWMRKDGVVKITKSPTRSEPDNAVAIQRRDKYIEHLRTENAKLQSKFRAVVIEPLKEEMSAQAWNAFIEPLLVAKIENGTIWLYSESPQWLTENYKAAIETKLQSAGSKATKVEFTDEIPK